MLNGTTPVVKERGTGDLNISLLSLLRLNIVKIPYNY